ncbi:MAG: tRNA methyltransferase [Nanoarchaeota archaeon]|nr:tRNA methyltransferase [Nanoarchaeota archaeon]
MQIAISPSGKKYLFEKDELHTSEGQILRENLVSGKVTSSSGAVFTVLKGSVSDLFDFFKRGPQVITLKDAGYILARSGVSKDSFVVDAGGGSGFLACFLGLHAGKVVTYELRKEFVSIIKKNVDLMSLSNVVIKNKDAYSDFDERDFDVLTLDLLEPWLVPTHGLRVGGFLVAYCPTIQQVEKVKRIDGFVVEEVCEIIKRDWKVNNISRPKSKMIAHTGFLVFLRKL